MFESLMQPGDVVTVTTDASGRKFRAFGPGAFQAIANRVPSGKAIGFLGETYEINEPGWTNGDVAAFQVPKYCAGLIGNVPPGNSQDELAPQRTVLRIKPNTAPDRNWLGQAIKIGYSGSIRFDLANIHFEGTFQGTQTVVGKTLKPGPGNDGTSPRLFTNVLAYNIADGCTARDILSTGWFGNNGAPPGETFGFQWLGSTSGVLCRVAVDSRRAPGEARFHGSAGITVANSLNVIVTDCRAHWVSNAGFVVFQSAGVETYNLTLGHPTDRTVHETLGTSLGSNLNHEQTTGTVHHSPVLNVYPVSRTGVHISHSNSTYTVSRSGRSIPIANGTVKVIDGKCSPILFGGKLTVQTWIPYDSGNTMTQANVPVIVDKDGNRVAAKWSFGSSWLDV